MGDRTNAAFSFDSATAGFAQDEMPFGFYVEHCRVQSQSDDNLRLFLIGSNGTDVEDGCPMDSSELDLHLSESHQNGTFSLSEYELAFDAFKFGDSGDLSLNCLFRLCLTGDCGVQSAANCTSVGGSGSTCFPVWEVDRACAPDPQAEISDHSSTTLAQCKALCEADPGCEKFQHSAGLNMCHLKEACDRTQSSPGYSIYERKTGAACPP